MHINGRNSRTLSLLITASCKQCCVAHYIRFSNIYQLCFIVICWTKYLHIRLQLPILSFCLSPWWIQKEYKILVRKSDRKTKFSRVRYRWQDNIKIYLKELRQKYKYVNWIWLKTGKLVVSSGEHGNKHLGSFLNKRQNNGLQTDKNYVPCIQISGKNGSTNHGKTYLRIRWCMM